MKQRDVNLLIVNPDYRTVSVLSGLQERMCCMCAQKHLT